MKLRVLVIDNRAEVDGTDDPALRAMVETLGQSTHEVQVLRAERRDPRAAGHLSRLGQPLWWTDAVTAMRGALRRSRPELIHLLDWDPAYTPLAYRAARRRRIPLVQSLPDFTVHCLAATYVRNGKRCTDCTGHGHWRGVVHRCHAGSFTASAGLAATLDWHTVTGHLDNAVTLYLAPTYHARRRLIDGGLPREKVIVRVPFVEVPLSFNVQRQGALYVGRLDADSGVGTLLAGVESAGNHGADNTIEVIGEGPMQAAIERNPAFRVAGPLPHSGRLEAMTRARYLIAPEPMYRRYPADVVDAAGCSLPAIASRTQGISEIVEDGVTGILFEPGDARDLERKIRWAESHPEAMREMGRSARLRYQDRFSPFRGGAQLLEAYELAVRLREPATGRPAEWRASAPPRSRG